MIKTVLTAALLILLLTKNGNTLDFARDTLYEPVLTGNPAYNTTKTIGIPVPVEVIDSIRYEAAPDAFKLGYLPELHLSLNGKNLICRRGACERDQSAGSPLRIRLDTLFRGKAPFTLAFLGMESCISSCPVSNSYCPCACPNAALFVARMTFFTSIPGGNPRGETGVFLMGDSYSCASRYVNPFETDRVVKEGAGNRPVSRSDARSRCGCKVNGRKSYAGQRRSKTRDE